MLRSYLNGLSPVCLSYAFPTWLFLHTDDYKLDKYMALTCYALIEHVFSGIWNLQKTFHKCHIVFWQTKMALFLLSFPYESPYDFLIEKNENYMF